MENVKKRELKIDGLRGLAVLAIWCFHFFAMFKIEEVGQLSKNFIDFLLIGVEMFFCLSGYLCFNSILERSKISSKPGLGFLFSRIFRLFPLYVLLLVLQGFFINASAASVLSNLFFIPYYVPEFTYGSLIPCAWTLAVELIFYSSVPWLFSKKFNKFEIFSISILLILLGSLCSNVAIYFGLSNKSFFVSRFFINYLHYFLAGWFIGLLFSEIDFHKKIEFVKSRSNETLALLLCLAIFIGAFFNATIGRLGTVFILLFLVKLNYSVLKKIIENVILVWLGKRCYGVYFFHFLFAFHWFNNTKMSINEGLGFSEGYLQATWFLITLIPILIFTELSWRLWEKPWIDFGKKVERKLETRLNHT